MLPGISVGNGVKWNGVERVVGKKKKATVMFLQGVEVFGNDGWR